MNILVTGACGQLGMELRRLGPQTGHRFVFTDISAPGGIETAYLDITDRQAVEIIARSEQADVIINCAAYNDVSRAESDVATADLLNHKAPEGLAAVAASLGALLIHVSSDYIFGGDASVPYTEDAAPSPLGVYGATKLKGETAVRKSGCKHLIFRTSWLYSPYGRNFLKTTLELTATRPRMQVVCDQVGSPTSAADLASVILGTIKDGLPSRQGTYNYSNEGVCSWYDFATAINELSGHGCSVLPCTSEEYPSPVRRPHYSVLDKTRIKRDFGITIPHWYTSLRTCMDRMGVLSSCY